MALKDIFSGQPMVTTAIKFDPQSAGIVIVMLMIAIIIIILFARLSKHKIKKQNG